MIILQSNKLIQIINNVKLLFNMLFADCFWKMKNHGLLYIQNQHGLLTLEIFSVSEQYAGTYTCTATNSEGEVTCSGHLNVLGTEREASPELDLSPKFMTPLQDISVTAGDEVVFTCLAKGNPMPHFKW